MAIEVLEWDGRHSYRQDIESFFYVLLWVCINYTAAGVWVVPRPTILDDWYESASIAAAVKLANMGPSRFYCLLDNPGAGFEVLKVILKS